MGQLIALEGSQFPNFYFTLLSFSFQLAQQPQQASPLREILSFLVSGGTFVSETSEQVKKFIRFPFVFWTLCCKADFLVHMLPIAFALEKLMKIPTGVTAQNQSY